jgi:plasmid stabilization system protein ParE
MSYSLIVLPTVLEDLATTLRDWEQFDAGRALLTQLAATFDKIRERPYRFPIVYGEVHRALTRRYHFAIFFEIVEERSHIVVLAVLHQRRDPALWPKR